MDMELEAVWHRTQGHWAAMAKPKQPMAELSKPLRLEEDRINKSGKSKWKHRQDKQPQKIAHQ